MQNNNPHEKIYKSNVMYAVILYVLINLVGEHVRIAIGYRCA